MGPLCLWQCFLFYFLITFHAFNNIVILAPAVAICFLIKISAKRTSVETAQRSVQRLTQIFSSVPNISKYFHIPPVLLSAKIHQKTLFAKAWQRFWAAFKFSNISKLFPISTENLKTRKDCIFQKLCEYYVFCSFLWRFLLKSQLSQVRVPGVPC